jgi:hypothetical protein
MNSARFSSVTMPRRRRPRRRGAGRRVALRAGHGLEVGCRRDLDRFSQHHLSTLVSRPDGRALEQASAREHAGDAIPGVDHRKIVLVGREQQLGGAPQGVLRGQRFELGDHRFMGDMAGDRLAAGLERDLLRRPEEDEDSDEREKEVRLEEAPDDEQSGDGLTDEGGDARGALLPQAHREQRAEHTAAVHRKRRNHVEQHEEDVRPEELLHEAVWCP